MLTLDATAVEHNIGVMGGFTAAHGVDLAPHGKTTMAPALWRRQLEAGAWAPDREVADLAWIVDVEGDEELDEALRAARSRVGAAGRVVVEGAGCHCRCGLSAIREHAIAAGLDILSFDHKHNRVVLAVAPRLALAA